MIVGWSVPQNLLPPEPGRPPALAAPAHARVNITDCLNAWVWNKLGGLWFLHACLQLTSSMNMCSWIAAHAVYKDVHLGQQL